MPSASVPRPLTAADAPALDRLLARHLFAGAYARSYLRSAGIGPDGVTGWACCGADATPSAALVAHDSIGWAVWDTPDQAAALAPAVAALGLTLLSGPQAMVAPLAAALPQPTRGDHCPFVTLHPAALVAPPAAAAWSPRPAGLADLEALIDFYIGGFYSLAYLPTRAAWATRLTEQLAQRTLYCLTDPTGCIVSAALSSAETPSAALIGGVATLEAYRGQGLSTRCVAALCAALFAGGRREIGLFYLSANAPAAHVYAKLGFAPAGAWWLERVGGRQAAVGGRQSSVDAD